MTSQIPQEDEPGITRQCYEMVGRYLWHWSLLEKSLDNAIQAALGVDWYRAQAIVKNMSAREKINALLFYLEMDLSVYAQLGDDAKKAKDMLIKNTRKIHALHDTRNMVAHSFFYAGDGAKREIVFSYVIRTGGLKNPEVKWGRDQFDAKIKQIDTLAEKLDKLPDMFIAWRKLIEGLDRITVGSYDLP